MSASGSDRLAWAGHERRKRNHLSVCLYYSIKAAMDRNAVVEKNSSEGAVFDIWPRFRIHGMEAIRTASHQLRLGGTGRKRAWLEFATQIVTAACATGFKKGGEARIL